MPRKLKPLLKKETKKQKKASLYLVPPPSISLMKEKNKKEFKKMSFLISHDLQSPLKTLSHFTELLKELLNEKGQEEKKEKALKYLKVISEGVNKLHLQLEGLKKYLVANQLQLREIQSEETLQILNEALLLFKDEIQARNAEIRIPSSVPKIFSDPEALKDIFCQLIDNALKFTEKKPFLTISAIQDKNQFVKFQIQDNGISIEKEFYEKIFHLFQSLHPINEYKGVGFGLALVKKAVEANGGKVGVISKKGEGSLFFFTLPSFPIPL